MNHVIVDKVRYHVLLEVVESAYLRRTSLRLNSKQLVEHILWVILCLQLLQALIVVAKYVSGLLLILCL
jgi:hypothetical protein